jgi:hypothetical protein
VSIRDATENEWIRNEILVKLGIDYVHIGTYSPLASSDVATGGCRDDVTPPPIFVLE